MSENSKEIEALAKIGTCLEMAWEDKRETFYAFTPAQLQKVIDTMQSTFEAQLEAARREGFRAARKVACNDRDLGGDSVTNYYEHETEDDYIADYKKQNGEEKQK